MSKAIKVNIEPLEDEINVRMMSAVGFLLGEIIMPKRMEQGLRDAYINSRAVESTYLFINGKEVTDGKDHNPYKGN